MSSLDINCLDESEYNEVIKICERNDLEYTEKLCRLIITVKLEYGKYYDLIFYLDYMQVEYIYIDS